MNLPQLKEEIRKEYLFTLHGNKSADEGEEMLNFLDSIVDRTQEAILAEVQEGIENSKHSVYTHVREETRKQDMKVIKKMAEDWNLLTVNGAFLEDVLSALQKVSALTPNE